MSCSDMLHWQLYKTWGCSKVFTITAMQRAISRTLAAAKSNFQNFKGCMMIMIMHACLS